MHLVVGVLFLYKWVGGGGGGGGGGGWGGGGGGRGGGGARRAEVEGRMERGAR